MHLWNYYLYHPTCSGVLLFVDRKVISLKKTFTGNISYTFKTESEHDERDVKTYYNSELDIAKIA